MKTLFNMGLIILLIFFSVSMANPVFFRNTAAAETAVSNFTTGNDTKATLSNDLKIAYEQTDDALTGGNFLTDNWGKLVIGLLAFAEVVVRITPTEKDNTVLNYLSRIINALIPNRRKDGGTF